MKWAKTKKDLSLIRHRLEKEKIVVVSAREKAIIDENLTAVNNFYQEIDDEPGLVYLHKKGFRVWRSVKKVPVKYQNARARYEAFVGGFLYYFEKHVSKIPKDNRTLYFDWGVLNKKKELTIFLNPLYGKTKIKLSDLNEKGSAVTGKSLSVINGNGKQSAKHNGKELVHVVRKKTTGKPEAFAIAPPPGTTGTVDPPPPPPPPPPPRD